MRSVVLFLAGLSVFAGGVGQADGSSVTLQQLLAGGSITVGDLTYSNFGSYSSLGLNGAPQVDPSTITVSPASGPESGLIFQSTALHVNAPNFVQTLNFQYDATSLIRLIAGADLSYFASASGAGNASIFESVTNTSGLNVSIPPGILTTHSDLSSPLKSIHVSDGINVNVSTGAGSAAITDFTNSFSQPTPEPSTGMLAVIGCGLVWRWRKSLGRFV